MAESEWRTDVRPGYRTKVVAVGPECYATIHRPILSEQERMRREEEVKAAMLRLAENAYKKIEGEKENDDEISA